MLGELLVHSERQLCARGAGLGWGLCTVRLRGVESASPCPPLRPVLAKDKVFIVFKLMKSTLIKGIYVEEIALAQWDEEGANSPGEQVTESFSCLAFVVTCSKM